MLRTAALCTLLALTTACSDGSDSRVDLTPRPFEGFTSDIYSDPDNWLCHPALAGTDNVCARNLDATLVFADGSTALEEHTPAAEPEVDCFYLYPTVSGDKEGNADLLEGEEEVFTAMSQAARYSGFCRVFAPVYRQITVTALFDPSIERDWELAYGDVLDSFKQYIANDNNGRGFILIGHSQGSGHLRRLVAETVEADEYLMEHMISAHLIGASVRAPLGVDTGGDFQRSPICRTSDQTGCVVAYVTYRDSDPFLAEGKGRFGVPGDAGSAICTHPGALSGGSAPLDAYFPTGSIPALEAVIIKQAEGPFADPDTAPAITTPFYKMPDFLSGECVVDDNGISYLEVTAHADPSDPRADSFNGEFYGGDGWGLHLVDITVGMGDLVALGASQSLAWLQQR